MSRIGIGLLALIVAGMALAASLFGRVQEKWSDFLMNLGTELVGIVVTVAVIDWLIKRREDYHSKRRRLVGGLAFICYDVLQKMLPDCYDWRVKDLENECRWFRESWERAHAYLSRDEHKDIQETISLADAIRAEIGKYVDRRQMLPRAKAEIRRADRERTTPQGVNRIYLHEVPAYDRLDEEIRRFEMGGVADASLLDALSVEIKLAGLEATLIVAIEQCIDLVKALAAEARALHEQIARYEESFLKTRKNIFQESRPE